jgi:predicted outer membrane repeat protein
VTEGGAVYVGKNADFSTTTGSTIADNSAGTYGGGIYVHANGKLSIHDLTTLSANKVIISDTVQTNRGAQVYWNAASPKKRETDPSTLTTNPVAGWE